MTRLWCELAWPPGAERAEAGMLLELEGDRVAAVRAGVPSPPGDAERLGGLTLPGLANAHSHAFQRALRGRTQAGTGSFWTWREQMYGLVAVLDPDRMGALARATFAEMALAGVTLVGEFHYVHHGPGGAPYAPANAMGEAIAAAAQDAGVRLTLLDACYLHGGIGREPDAVQRRFRDDGAEAWAARVDALAESPAMRVGAAIHSVRAVDPGSARAVAAWADARDRPLHAHVSEQTAENEACLAAYGRTPTAVLRDAGAVSERSTAVHATHVTAGDVRLLGQARATVCLCPTTERDLADGVGPAGRLREAGARLAVGSDSQAVIDLLEEARAIELDERLVGGERGGHRPAELLGAATGGGYASLGWPDGGRLEAGALADLTVLDLDGVRLAGTRAEDAVDAAVFAGTAGDVRHVMVGGRWVVRDGAHCTLDVAGELRSALAAVAP